MLAALLCNLPENTQFPVGGGYERVGYGELEKRSHQLVEPDRTQPVEDDEGIVPVEPTESVSAELEVAPIPKAEPLPELDAGPDPEMQARVQLAVEALRDARKKRLVKKADEEAFLMILLESI